MRTRLGYETDASTIREGARVIVISMLETYLPQRMKVKSESEISVMSDSSRPHGRQPTRLLHPWDFPGKSTGVGCHCLLR